jgi:hypothetical protein
MEEVESKRKASALMTNEAELTEYYTPAEVAALARVTKGTLATMRYQGRGPAYVKLGNSRSAHVRYPKDGVHAWLSGRVVQTSG